MVVGTWEVAEGEVDAVVRALVVAVVAVVTVVVAAKMKEVQQAVIKGWPVALVTERQVAGGKER